MSLEEMLADGPPPPPPRIPTPPPEPIELEDAPGTQYPIRALFYSDGNLNSFYVATEVRTLRSISLKFHSMAQIYGCMRLVFIFNV